MSWGSLQFNMGVVGSHSSGTIVIINYSFLCVHFYITCLWAHLSETPNCQLQQTKEVWGKLLGCWIERKQVILCCLQVSWILPTGMVGIHGCRSYALLYHFIYYCALYLQLWLFQSTPKPVLTLLDLSFPLASSDLGADSLENEFMMNNMHLSQASF